MNNINRELINYDSYLLELNNEYEERFTDASLHIIIRYCIEHRSQILKLRSILSLYLKQDLIAYGNNAGAAGSKKNYFFNEINVLHRIIYIIDILDSGYYVYLLKDSSTKTVFHVGMGTGSNICDYENYDRSNNCRINRKLKNKIIEINDNDNDVRYEVVDTNLRENEASIVQQLKLKEYDLQKNYSFIRSSLSKGINLFYKLCTRFINAIRYNRSDYIAHFEEPHRYSDIEIEHIVEQILFDFDEYLRNNLSIPTYDCYENRYQMDGYI